MKFQNPEKWLILGISLVLFTMMVKADLSDEDISIEDVSLENIPGIFFRTLYEGGRNNKQIVIEEPFEVLQEPLSIDNSPQFVLEQEPGPEKLVEEIILDEHSIPYFPDEFNLRSTNIETPEEALAIVAGFKTDPQQLFRMPDGPEIIFDESFSPLLAIQEQDYPQIVIDEQDSLQTEVNEQSNLNLRKENINLKSTLLDIIEEDLAVISQFKPDPQKLFSNLENVQIVPEEEISEIMIEKDANFDIDSENVPIDEISVIGIENDANLNSDPENVPSEIVIENDANFNIIPENVPREEDIAEVALEDTVEEYPNRKRNFNDVPNQQQGIKDFAPFVFTNLYPYHYGLIPSVQEVTYTLQPVVQNVPNSQLGINEFPNIAIIANPDISSQFIAEPLLSGSLNSQVTPQNTLRSETTDYKQTGDHHLKPQVGSVLGNIGHIAGHIAGGIASGISHGSSGCRGGYCTNRYGQRYCCNNNVGGGGGGGVGGGCHHGVCTDNYGRRVCCNQGGGGTGGGGCPHGWCTDSYGHRSCCRYGQTGGGNHVGGGCIGGYCTDRYGRQYCCNRDGVHDDHGTAGGHCPQNRHSCLSVSGHHHHCQSDGNCDHGERCCYDNCLSANVCKRTYHYYAYNF